MNDLNAGKKNTAFYLTVVLSAVGFVLLFCALPLTLDDWAWGGEKGIMRLQNGFANYNGRYLGNLLVIALTRFKAARVIVMTAVMLWLTYAVNQLVEKRRSALGYTISLGIVLSTVLTGFLGAKMNIFAQTIGWVSGFCNYVLPAACACTFLLIFERAEDKKPRKAEIAGMLLFGTASSLFNENMTVFFVLVSLCAAVYLAKKNKASKAIFFSFFAGSLLGAAVMFSNSSYLNMLKNGDTLGGMRGVGFVGKSALDELASQLGIGILAIVLLIIAAIAIFAVLLVFALRSRDVGLILPLVFIALMTAPLLFANGGEKAYIFTARLYFAQYIFAMIFLARVLKRSRCLKPIKAVSLAASLCIIAIVVVLYAQIHIVDTARTNAIENSKDSEFVEVVEYPDALKRFVYMSDAYKSPEWEDNFKSFYGIDAEKPLVSAEY